MIIDESVFSDIASPNAHQWSLIRNSLLGLRASSRENHKLHFGGTYYRAAVKKGGFVQFLAILEKAGRVQKIVDADVDRLEAEWKGRRDLECDTDHWALALAQASGSRLLASNDDALRNDFRRKLTPRGVTICRGVIRSPNRTAFILKSAA